MITRIITAALVGGFLVSFHALATYYADFIAFLAGSAFGTMFSGAAACILSLLFLPVLLTTAWEKWRELWWVPCVLFACGILSTIVSRLPLMVREGLDPEFGTIPVYESHPYFALAGWLLILVAIVTFPKLGLSESKRWV